MKTVAQMREELAKFPDDAYCYAYEGEVTGLVVVRSRENYLATCIGVIHCHESRDGEPATEVTPP